jgi:hypothetical protein
MVLNAAVRFLLMLQLLKQTKLLRLRLHLLRLRLHLLMLLLMRCIQWQ